MYACEPQKFDLIILNAEVYSGEDQLAKRQDVGIIGDKIAAIGNLQKAEAPQRFDAQNLALSPGFIDVHAHLDPIFRYPDAESHVRQGVTTALGGPDGGGPVRMEEHLSKLEAEALGMNVGFLVGHNSIREKTLGNENRAPTADELDTMKVDVANAMEAGAFGLSTGLKYLPGAFSEVGEVIALSAVAAEYGGIYTSHLREEGLGLIEGVQEAIEIAEKADIPVVLTHHKAIGQPMWGASKRTLAMIDSARAIGLDIMADQYPYIASYTGISVLIPAWARAGGRQAFVSRTQDSATRDSIHAGIVFNILNDRGGGDLKRIMLARVRWDESLEGKTLYDWAIQKGLEPTPENGADLVLEAQLKGGASCIYFAMSDEDVDRIMAHPMTMIASDGRLTQPGEGHPHPRWYGTFPRVLGYYSRERKIIPLHTAIHKMTRLPALRMGLENRGIIRKGAYADLVIFDPKTVIDEATFQDPHQYPTGIYQVWVNGVHMVKDGKLTPQRGGRVLYGPGKTPLQEE